MQEERSDFEDFMREVVAPAAVRARPHQVGMWHLLRPDWLLQPLFEEAYGAEASREHLKYFEDMVDGEQTVYALDGEVPL